MNIDKELRKKNMLEESNRLKTERKIQEDNLAYKQPPKIVTPIPLSIDKVDITPLNNYVLVLPIPTQEETRKSGIIIPETAQKTPSAIIVALPNSIIEDNTNDLEVGHIVALRCQYQPVNPNDPTDRRVSYVPSGLATEYNGKIYILMALHDILYKYNVIVPFTEDVYGDMDIEEAKANIQRNTTDIMIGRDVIRTEDENSVTTSVSVENNEEQIRKINYLRELAKEEEDRELFKSRIDKANSTDDFNDLEGDVHNSNDIIKNTKDNVEDGYGIHYMKSSGIKVLKSNIITEEEYNKINNPNLAEGNKETTLQNVNNTSNNMKTINNNPTVVEGSIDSTCDNRTGDGC